MGIQNKTVNWTYISFHSDDLKKMGKKSLAGGKSLKQWEIRDITTSAPEMLRKSEQVAVNGID